MSPNDNVSMSVGHLDHVLIVVFLIQSASFIHLICCCASLSTTFALSQSIIWFSFTPWSVMAVNNQHVIKISDRHRNFVGLLVISFFIRLIVAHIVL